MTYARSSCSELFCKKRVLKYFVKLSGKHLCHSLVFNEVAGLAILLKKETLAQVFHREFCAIFKNTLLTEQLRWLILLCWRIVILRIQWRLIFVNAISCSWLQLWVGYFIYFNFTPVLFQWMFLIGLL